MRSLNNKAGSRSVYTQDHNAFRQVFCGFTGTRFVVAHLASSPLPLGRTSSGESHPVQPDAPP